MRGYQMQLLVGGAIVFVALNFAIYFVFLGYQGTYPRKLQRMVNKTNTGMSTVRSKQARMMKDCQTSLDRAPQVPWNEKEKLFHHCGDAMRITEKAVAETAKLFRETSDIAIELSGSQDLPESRFLEMNRWAEDYSTELKALIEQSNTMSTAVISCYREEIKKLRQQNRDSPP